MDRVEGDNQTLGPEYEMGSGGISGSTLQRENFNFCKLNQNLFQTVLT